MFNHEARWDRKLPASNNPETGAPISVNCQMTEGRILPRSFEWKDQTFDIEKINFFWKDKKGKEELFFYSVNTQKGSYQILLTTPGFNWRLIKLIGP